MTSPFGVVILAGGSGDRFGGGKQFHLFEGKELWEYPVDVCKDIDYCEEIVVVFPKGIESKVSGIKIVDGARGRARDCLSALEHISSKRVVVLEAARPLVTREQVFALAGGLYPSIEYGYREVNTVIEGDENYIDKKDCFELLGTGGYDTEMLWDSYNFLDTFGHIDDYSCDSYAIWSMKGIKPLVWPVGPLNNLFKVTYPHDIKILSVIKEEMEKHGGEK